MRMDYSRGRHTSDGRYYFDLATDRGSAGPISSYAPTEGRATMNNIANGDTFVVTPSRLNQLRAGFNRFTVTRAHLNPAHIPQFGSNFPLLGPPLPPSLNLTGRVNLGSNASADPWTVNESYQFAGNLQGTRGRPSMKVGFEYLKVRYYNLTVVRTMGVFDFTGRISGDSAAGFVLGNSSLMNGASPVRDQGGVQRSTWYYVPDDWKIHPRLTLNLGPRYELALPWFHPNDWWGTFHAGERSQVIPSAPAGLVYPGDRGVPRGLIQTGENNFPPRVGFACDPFGKGRTSVRGAYGIFSETMNANIIQNDGQPFNYTFTIPRPYSLTNPLRGQAPIPPTVDTKNPLLAGLQQVSCPDPNMRTGYVQQFNLMVQHEVVRNLSLPAGYAGKLGRKLMMVVNGNPAVFQSGATLAHINQRRICQGCGENRVISTPASSCYNGPQAQVKKRHSQGFTVQGAYPWARSMDMASGITTSIAQSPPRGFDLSARIGLSDVRLELQPRRRLRIGGQVRPAKAAAVAAAVQHSGNWPRT